MIKERKPAISKEDSYGVADDKVYVDNRESSFILLPRIIKRLSLWGYTTEI